MKFVAVKQRYYEITVSSFFSETWCRSR